MFTLEAPGEVEICLRPDLAIPACQALVRAGPLQGESRIWFEGPAFRVEPEDGGRSQQFQQLGAALVGAAGEAADAEAVGLAAQGLRACGIDDAVLVLNDQGLLSALIAGLPIGDRVRSRLLRFVASPQQMLRALQAAMDQGAAAKAPLGADLTEALALLGPGRSQVVIEDLLALADVRHVGGRTVREIAARLVARAADSAGAQLPPEIGALIRAFVALRGSPTECLRAARELAARVGVELGAAADRFERRLEILAQYDVPRDAVVVEFGLQRGVAYQSGFVFEFHQSRLGTNSQLCGGGRYDRLLEHLGTPGAVPAVGFAFGFDRLLLALDRPPDHAPSPVEAVVVALDDACAAFAVRVVRALHEAGWRARMDHSGRPKAVVRQLAREGVPYAVFIGGDEARRGSARIKDLATREQTDVALDQLASFVRATRKRGDG